MKMRLHFYKYHGTGNDFILLDNRDEKYPLSDEKLYQQLCFRRFGIGADGVILLQKHANYDFEMLYFNSDGRLGSMCGNGARCIVAFAHQLGMIDDHTTFAAFDGPHQATLITENEVRVQMGDVSEYEIQENYVVMNTGSPHYVTFVDDVEDIDVFREGKLVRESEPFQKKGINVNFVEIQDKDLNIRTYERGVESETYSCGTGVIASALSAVLKGVLPKKSPITIQTRGGQLQVGYEQEGANFKKVWLQGGVQCVFLGDIEV